MKKFPQGLIDSVAMALAITDQFGTEFEDKEQREQHIKLYQENHPLFPDTSKIITRDAPDLFIRGKDHWRKLAQAALEASDEFNKKE